MEQRQPEGPEEMPAASSGRLFVFYEPGTRRTLGAWRIAVLISGQPLRPSRRRFIDRAGAEAAAQECARQHGMRVLLAVPRITARLR